MLRGRVGDGLCSKDLETRGNRKKKEYNLSLSTFLSIMRSLLKLELIMVGR